MYVPVVKTLKICQLWNSKVFERIHQTFLEDMDMTSKNSMTPETDWGLDGRNPVR
jgi:hypothetical protein